MKVRSMVAVALIIFLTGWTLIPPLAIAPLILLALEAIGEMGGTGIIINPADIYLLGIIYWVFGFWFIYLFGILIAASMSALSLFIIKKREDAY